MNQAQAYVAGWEACLHGEDGRYTNPFLRHSEESYAWTHGFLDAMDAEDGESPQPATAGYHELESANVG